MYDVDFLAAAIPGMQWFPDRGTFADLWRVQVGERGSATSEDVPLHLRESAVDK